MSLVLTGASGLETLLPAATIAAVGAAPGGLTLEAQVYVSRKPRAAPSATSPQAWWRPLDPVALEGGLGSARRGYVYELTIEKAGGTEAEMRAWVQALAAKDGYRWPLATGLWAAFVEALVVDLHPKEGTAVAVRGRFRFEE